MHDTLVEYEHATLLDLLDRLLATGVVVDGEIDLSVADINLVHLGLKLVLASSATLEQRSKGSATRLAEPIDIPLGDSLEEGSLGSTSYPEPLIPARAESKVVADVQPECTAQRVLSSRPTFGQEEPSESLHPGMARFEGTPCVHDRDAERALSKTDPARLPHLPSRAGRTNFDPAKVERGLAKLVLTLVELLRRLMERQAVRKMEGGTLTEIQVEGLGEAFRRLETKMVELKRVFGLNDEELNLDLGPLGSLM